MLALLGMVGPKPYAGLARLTSFLFEILDGERSGPATQSATFFHR